MLGLFTIYSDAPYHLISDDAVLDIIFCKKLRTTKHEAIPARPPTRPSNDNRKPVIPSLSYHIQCVEDSPCKQAKKDPLIWNHQFLQPFPKDIVVTACSLHDISSLSTISRQGDKERFQRFKVVRPS